MSLLATLFSPKNQFRVAGRRRITRLIFGPEPSRDTPFQDTSLSDLLKLLLGLGEDAPVAVTPSFQSWLGPHSGTRWPPGAGVSSLLWLVDTRDAIARRELDVLTSAAKADSLPCVAAVVLTGTGKGGNALRQLLRRFRHPGTRRLPPDRLFQPAVVGGQYPVVSRFAFEDGPFLPSEFWPFGATGLTGTAFLLTRRPLFHGPLWSLIANCLNADEVEVDSFQLRARGAAVVTLRSGGRPFVIRVVPPGPLQDVVARNHQVLLALRASLVGEEQLLRRIPAPVFSAHSGVAAVFGETLLAGTLAWKVATGALEPVVYRNAIHFLDTLRAVTARTVTLHGAFLRELIQGERSLVAGSSFVSEGVRRAFANEIETASTHLEGADLPLYTSHGDFGYGNVLVNAGSGEIEGVIDWDTARLLDFPGIDRVNLEIQIRRRRESITMAVESVWRLRSAHEALHCEAGPQTSRALFALAVCRYISRSIRYPALYAREAAGFERVLQWLSQTGR